MVDLIELISDPVKRAEVQAIRDRYRALNPNPTCVVCEGSGLRSGEERIQRTFRQWLRRQPYETNGFFETCGCLTIQQDHVDKEMNSE